MCVCVCVSRTALERKWHLRWTVENGELQAMSVSGGGGAGKVPESRMPGPVMQALEGAGWVWGLFYSVLITYYFQALMWIISFKLQKVNTTITGCCCFSVETWGTRG